MKARATLLTTVLAATLFAGAGPALAQQSYDDHKLTDRFYIRLGGYHQTGIRTTLRLDAKTPSAAVQVGTVIGLESLFKMESSVSAGRIDGWYRFGKKSRVNFTYWRTTRDGTSTYNQADPIEIGDITITPGDNVRVELVTKLLAVGYSYSFLNTSKYEAWIGGGFNFQGVDSTVVVNVGGGTTTLDQSANATVPIPTLQFGGRWNFTPRVRMILLQEAFGVSIGDYSGKLNDTRLLAEWDITKHFGIGGGAERYSLEVDADAQDFTGQLDSSYSALSLYILGQF